MPSPTGFSTTTDVDFGAFPSIANDYPTDPDPFDSDPFTFEEFVAALPSADDNDTVLDAQLYGLLTGTKWGSGIGSGVALTYSFPGAGSSWDVPNSYDFGEFNEPFATHFGGLSVAQQTAVTTALTAYSHVANITFTLVADTAEEVGDIRVAVTDGGAMDPSIYAYAFTPAAAPWGGDVWINYTQPTSSGNDFSLGANGYSTVLHELGHAIGLDHPFSLYAFDHLGSYVGALDQFDTFQYTTMTYSDATDHQDNGDSSYYPTTPMWLDIQALQYLYGANTTHNLGATTYLFSEGQNYYETIYDAGGIDTFQYSSTSDGALIDLRGDFFFSQLGNAISLSNGGSNANNVTIYVNGDSSRLIENAIGGGGADSIVGNDGANRLEGGSGSDTLTGGVGDDTLLGGGQGDSLVGGGGLDRLEGNSGFDTLQGQGGIDWLQAGPGNDWLEGNSGFDTVDGAAGADSVFGGPGNDLAVGGGGNDWLEGNAGFDTMVGGVGNDTLVGGPVAGGAGSDVFRYDATSLGSGDAAANGIDSISGGAGDLISMLGLTDELEIGNVKLNVLTGNTVLGSSLVAGQTNIAFAGGVLQIDFDGDGTFEAATEFQMTLTGVASVTFQDSDDLFHLA